MQSKCGARPHPVQSTACAKAGGTFMLCENLACEDKASGFWCSGVDVGKESVPPGVCSFWLKPCLPTAHLAPNQPM